MSIKSNQKAPAPPQHVLDTRYLKELGERIFPSGQSALTFSKEEEETMIEQVGRDLQDAARRRCCNCDPDERRKEEGCDEDTDDKDGWFCSFRNIEPEYKIRAVLDQARLDIDTNPSDFPKDIREEILEWYATISLLLRQNAPFTSSLSFYRYLLEYDKDFQAPVQKQSNRLKTCLPPSTPPPTVFPPFSFQHLPREILVEIVLLAQGSNPHTHITLSHVDASLRAFVNLTPLLWSRVDFLYPMPVVHVYLERSAETLLKVTALPPPNNGFADHPLLEDGSRDEYSKMKQFFRALRHHRHRIVSLRLRFDDLCFDVSDDNNGQTIAHDFLWDGSMAKLKLLNLELETWMGAGPSAIPPSDSIKELHLRGPWTKHYMPLFSTRLESLVVADHRVPFSRIFDALHATPCLTSLTFCNISIFETKGKEGSVLNFDHLESLSLIRVFGSAAEVLGKCIVAPNLVSYTFQHPIILHNVRDWKDINQLQLFPAPQPSVRRLDLTACDGAPSFFDSVFRTFPCITHLRIAFSNLSHEHLLGAVVKPTSEGEPGQTALPDLEHLTIDNEFNEITVDSDVAQNDIEMIESIIPNFEVEEFNQSVDVYGDSDDSASETSSIGSWASGDHEVLVAFMKYRMFGDIVEFIEDLPSEDFLSEGEE
ncbi:hypothetical protein M407DRAFT_23237 [Tulasnella calospora MUT 4182]|uniref:F-box domain-containing protein n=1 Tax=Tulasnella calospora MUT 4182 TaxID=1051891 RepID=A0A0C3QJZ5_9AGAM|nr:hypothetical protein M407DRAFT_23237 [Tulasnella calospora MUT 4182]